MRCSILRRTCVEIQEVYKGNWSRRRNWQSVSILVHYLSLISITEILTLATKAWHFQMKITLRWSLTWFRALQHSVVVEKSIWKEHRYLVSRNNTWKSIHESLCYPHHPQPSTRNTASLQGPLGFPVNITSSTEEIDIPGWARTIFLHGTFTLTCYTSAIHKHAAGHTYSCLS